MSNGTALELCYNRGCGKKYDPNDNKEDDCTHHPGVPVFHDAYKGWSCCKKKCIDFTEFLNIKGCTKSSHSNLKPQEPPTPKLDIKSETNEIKRKPLNSTPPMKRPPFDAPQLTLTPTINPSLLEEVKCFIEATDTTKPKEVQIGETCKNSSCKSTYTGPESDNEICEYHSGLPVFHDGLKYWSCCNKKTTQFSVFLEQKGCATGHHVWIQKTEKKELCRMDWHQTGMHVVISIYAKKYHPYLSSVKLNPIHLTTNLYFPEENAGHEVDLELRGIVDVENSQVRMTSTKVEITLKKKEPGSWAKLDFPRIESSKTEEPSENNLSARVDAVDLNDL